MPARAGHAEIQDFMNGLAGYYAVLTHRKAIRTFRLPYHLPYTQGYQAISSFKLKPVKMPGLKGLI